MKWRRTSVRVSLTLWNVAAMIIVLAVYASGVFIFVSRNLSNQLDSSLRDRFQFAVAMADQRPDGTLKWFEDDRNGGEDSPWMRVWEPSGKLIFQTAVAERNPIPGSETLAIAADGRVVPVQTSGTTVRIFSGRSTIDGRPVIIQVARSEAAMDSDLTRLLLILLLGLPIGVAAAGGASYLLARRALAPIETMADRARSITADRLGDRLPVDNPDDELGRLATVFNETLGRLQASFEQMRRFTADVSHELRTPLTAIRSVGEVGLRERRDEPAYRGIIGSMLEEVDRLASLVDRLLTWSRAETGQAKLAQEVLNLHEMAEEVAAHLGVLAEEKQQLLVVEHAGTPRGLGDRLVLRQSLINLVDNAIKYSPVGGEIRIKVGESPTVATIDVSDTGPGIAPELQAQIFERYARGGRSRPQAGGTGLGLSISKWAVEVNGGKLTLESGNGGGSTFRITLPRAGAARSQDSRRRIVA